MYKGKRTSRFAAWLAILAMALNAFWPLLANAGPAGAGSLLEVCTAQGMQVVAGVPASAPDGPEKHLQLHCPLCSTGVDKVVAPPATPLRVERPALAAAGPAASELPADSRRVPHTPAQPRAPPSIS